MIKEVDKRTNQDILNEQVGKDKELGTQPTIKSMYNKGPRATRK